MPVVPIRPAAPASAQPMPQPDPTFLAMAAAQMHGEGKFDQESAKQNNAKVKDETTGYFHEGYDTGYKQLNGPSLYVQRRNSVDLFHSKIDGSRGDDFNSSMTKFMEDNNLKAGDVVRNKDGKHYMYNPSYDGKFYLVEPKEEVPTS